ncbi:FadR/GntR family transcriptional regulator [Pseudonocardia hispaniensis]|uniref:FadR/GntR family transcriptional regulator n=1 Tax=Pseudonocardia hispaniensis TaxID=904933 RepID=A0ABW1IZD9_9PSEU
MRRALQQGQFRPGDRLPTERDLAMMLSVSRTTVRAAIAVLERDGLISVRRGRGGGFIVQERKYDPVQERARLRQNRAALRDAFDYRTIVEAGAARLAAERRLVADVKRLRKISNSMDRVLRLSLTEQKPQLVSEFQALDSAFHLGIAEASRNSHLAEAVADARGKMWMPVGSLFGRLEPNANDQHEALVDAIEVKDGDLAASIMEEHISGTRVTVEAWLKR